MKEMMGSDAGDPAGQSAQSKGPSPSYAGKLRAAIYPNITFIRAIAGNPTADVQVQAAPDGTIISRRLVKSSGIPEWDEAVLDAITKTGKLPRDEDGTVPKNITIGFRPQP
jgi:colicin import membrane protein